MPRVRLGCALAAAAGAALLPAGAQAQIQAPTQTLVVTGSREPLSSDRLAADVVIIDGDTLRSTTADSLADVLRRQAGVQVSRSGGPGQASSIFVRGASSQQSVLLVDGVRIGSATLGYAAFEALGLVGIDRVEVLRGPGSSLYGADAVGGVVQVFTRAAQTGPDGSRLEGRAAGGGLGGLELSGGLSGRRGPWDYAATLAREQNRGVSALRAGDALGNYNADADGFRRDTASLRLGLAAAPEHRIGLTLLQSRNNAQYDSSQYLPPDYSPDPSPDFRTRLLTQAGALDWRGRLGEGLTGSARVSGSIDDSRSGGSVLDIFKTTREGASAQLAWQTGWIGQLVAAVEHQRDRASSSSYREPVERRNDAVVAELTGAASGLAWQADVRRDRPSDFDAVTTGRLGGSLALASGLRLRMLLGNTFRAPSFNDLYYPDYGVATLRPERGQSTEIGLVWRNDQAEASAIAFRNRVRDLIGYESNRTRCPVDPGYDYGCAANINRARLEGLTLTGSGRAGAWSLSAQLDLLTARDDLSGERLARRATQQTTLAASWMAGDWTLGASLLRVGDRPDAGTMLAAETTLDLSAHWRMAPAWEWQAKLLNAGNARTEPARDYQGLGRQGWLVLSYAPKL